ncbi:YtxH domain-containing protein [Actinomyces trachealis]|uniref:YtxH domain-containing protein n=1 Tax=Actinomyces trachealis TaxID=2763540 RepID=UPI001892AD39|nr:YtxH domain-containing protein [Actinomyces trachealis]
MASKIPFIIGLGAGYVLGTRAGRAQYERIKSAAAHLAENPAVRERVDAAQARVSEAVRRQGETVTDKVADAVKDRFFGPRNEPTVAPIKGSTVDAGEGTLRPLD